MSIVDKDSDEEDFEEQALPEAITQMHSTKSAIDPMSIIMISHSVAQHYSFKNCLVI